MTTEKKMKDADMPLSDRIEAAIKRVTTGYGQMRVPVEATDPDVVLFDCLAELDAARARERHALVAGAEVLRRIAAATPIGHEDVTKGPSTYCWLCYAASLLMAEAATTPATPLEQELITLRAREAKLRAALEPFAAYMDARDAKPFNGLGDTIHAIHTGTEWAAELTLAHCQAARAALAEGED